MILETNSHDGGKPVACAAMGEKDWFFTAGFNKLRQRQFKIWNSTDLSCIATETIDQGTGALSLRVKKIFNTKKKNFNLFQSNQ